MTAAIPDFTELLRRFVGEKEATSEQMTCSHILSSKMPDGKFFCPSCRRVSAFELVKR